ncbi:MAG: S1C family serine protease [Acidimicrobiales bacterium]
MEEHPDESGDSRPDPMLGFDGDGEPMWRHPSEIGAMMAVAHGIEPPTITPTRYRRAIRATSVAASIAVLGATVISLSSGGPNPSSQLVTVGRTPSISNLQAPDTTIASVAGPVSPSEHPGVVTIQRWGGGNITSGSGVLIFDNGFIATSRELVAGASRLIVRPASGEAYEAHLVAGDYISNIAVLRIDAPDLAAPDFADRSPSVGDAVTVADAWSVEGFDTRLAQVDQVITDRYNFPRHELFEFGPTTSTTAAGAPLLDSRGDVIGLVIPVEDSAQFRYAVDIATVRSVAHQLIETGRTTYVAWMGIKGLNAGDDSGALVETVVLNSPAAMAGIEPGDTITSVARRNVGSIKDLHKVLKQLESRQTVVVDFVRDDQLLTSEIRLGLRVQVVQE